MGRTFTTPDWVKEAVFYQIFPDRFARSLRVNQPGNLEPWDSPPTIYGFKGGDLLGVMEHLDYLHDLGITAIYFNPVFQSASNHRYHTHDYYKIDPLLGGNDAFRLLLDESHRRNIRVVLDGVFNHASRGFFQFNHILETGPSSPYIDWFDIKGFPLNAYGGGELNYGCWFNLPALPEFNMNNPQVREYIFDITRYWLEQGIDGWRLDVPFCIDDDAFWQEFRQVAKSVNPEAYLVGEIPWEAQRWLQGDQFDAVMNYQLTQACLGFFGGKKIDRYFEEKLMGLDETPVLDAAGFARRVEELLKIYPREAALAQLNLLSSHDMPRFLALVGGDRSAFKLATLFQMTYPGAPCVYYGDEIGLRWDRVRESEGSRYAFPWGEEGRPHPSWDIELFEHFKRCIAIRNTYPALRQGDFVSLHAQDGIYAYLRKLADQQLVIVLNNTSSSYHLDIPVEHYLPEGAHVLDLIGGSAARVVDGHLTRLALPPYSGSVFSV